MNEIRAHQIRPLEGCVEDVGSREVGAAERSVGEPGLEQIRVGEVGPIELRTLEPRALEADARRKIRSGIGMNAAGAARAENWVDDRSVDFAVRGAESRCRRYDEGEQGEQGPCGFRGPGGGHLAKLSARGQGMHSGVAA